MIIRQLGSHRTGFIVKTVICEYDIVSHHGSECSGSMCLTTARTIGQTRPVNTPGRRENIMYIAENMSTRSFGKVERALKPDLVYLRNGEQRANGLYSLGTRYLKTTARADEDLPPHEKAEPS